MKNEPICTLYVSQVARVQPRCLRSSCAYRCDVAAFLGWDVADKTFSVLSWIAMLFFLYGRRQTRYAHFMFRTLQTLQSFLDSRFKILGETFWIQLLSRLDSWIQDSRFKILGETFWIQILLDSRFKIQDSRRNFLNPDPPSRLTSPGFKIQDSRFWGKLFESQASWIQDSRF